MADPDTQQEALPVLVGQRRIGCSDIRGGVHPKIQDSGSDHRPLSCSEEVADRLEHRPTDVWNPQRGEAEFIQFRCSLGGFGWVAVTELTAPHPDTGKIHR